MSISETARSLASLIKTLISTGLICLVGYVGGWLYINFNPQIQLQQKEHELQQARASLATAERQLTNQNAMIKSLGEDLEASQKRVVQLDTSLRLLKVTHRVAEITVLSQQQLENGQLVTEFQFQEMNDQGVPIDRRHTFKIEGDLLYLDYWVVKFDDQYIEQADLDRSSSICLFRRMFGEHQEPYEGYVVDEVGMRPNAYGRGGVISEFERQIWTDFWNIANDPTRAAAMGIRAAHGVAPAMRLRAGKHYRVTLRASDGLSITPVEVAAGRSSDLVPIR